MYALTDQPTLLVKRAAALVAIAAAVAALAAALATGTSARQTIVHTHLAQGGTVVVSGYDGGVPLAPKSAP